MTRTHLRGISFEILLPALLTLLALAVRLVQKHSCRVDVAVGADSVNWGMAALGLRDTGECPLLPPLYPWLLVLSSRCGDGLADAGLAVSLVAGTLVAPAAWLAVRAAGGTTGAATVTGVLCAIHPDLSAHSLLFQADASATLCQALCLAAALGHAVRRSWASLLGLGLAAGFFAACKENGLVAGLLLAALAAVVPPSTPVRMGRLPAGALAGLLVLLACALWPLLLSSDGGSTASKSGLVLDDLRRIWDGGLPDYARGGPALGAGTDRRALRDIGQEYLTLPGRASPEARLALALRLNARKALATSGDLLSWLGLGTLGLLFFALQERRPRVLLALLLLLPAVGLLGIWSERRHAAIFVASGFVGVGLLLSSLELTARRSQGWRRAVAGVSLGALLLGIGMAMPSWSRLGQDHEVDLARMATRNRLEADLGRRLRRQARRDDVLQCRGFPRVQLYAELPTNEGWAPERSPGSPGRLLVAVAEPSPGARVLVSEGRLAVEVKSLPMAGWYPARPFRFPALPPPDPSSEESGGPPDQGPSSPRPARGGS